MRSSLSLNELKTLEYIERVGVTPLTNDGSTNNGADILFNFSYGPAAAAKSITRQKSFFFKVYF